MSIHPALKALAEKRRKVEPEKYDPAVDSDWLDTMATINAPPATAEIIELPDGFTHEVLEDLSHIDLALLLEIMSEEE